MANSKIHVGLITQDKELENSVKQGLDQIGGGYLHSARGMLELYQKMGMQKIQLIVYAAPPGDSGAESQALVGFFRGKRETAGTPICILVESAQVQMKRLLKDPRTRGFSKMGGVFLALMTMQPLVAPSGPAVESEVLSLDWIQREFLESLQVKVGQGHVFSVAPATDDDLHAGFFCQFSDEVRSHLGWFKFAARMQDSGPNGMGALFQGLSSEDVEPLAEALLTGVVAEFKAKVEGDLQSRGAIFYPPLEEFTPAEKKMIYANSRSSGLLFGSAGCSVLLEVIQYI